MGSKLKNLLKARVGAAAQQQPSAPAATGVKRARQEKNQRAGKAAKQRKAVHRANRGSNTSHARADAQRRARQREDAPDALAEELQVGKLVGTEGSAYTALLGALSSSSSALRHRQVEQEGDSAGEESESDEGEGQEGEEAEGVDAADGDEDGDEVDDLAKLSTAELEALLAEEEGERAEGQTNIGEQDDEGSMGGSDGEDEGRAVAVDTWSRKGLQAAKTTPAVTKQDAAAASRAAAAAATAAAADAPDTFAQHMTRELSDSDKVALQGARPKPQDAPETPVYQDAFKGRWQLSGRTCLPDAPSTLAAMGVKERLITRWVEVHQEDVRQGFTDPSASASASAGPSSMAAANEAGGSAAAAGRSGRQAKGKGSAAAGADADPVPCATAGGFVSLQQRSFFAALNSYADVVLPGRQYPQGDLSAPDWCMDAYLLHALNHISKTADRIKKNNEKIEALVAAGGQRAALEVECRDQGFTRPKVLLLLPQRNFAFKLIRRLVALAMHETRADSVQGKEKFVKQFTEAEDEDADEKAKARRASKPAEWRALFSGNVDDHFRLGIKLTRGAIKLFADLFQSDIIVASPIALATMLADDAAANDGKQSSAVDFLSSIEVLVIDRADVLTMQNWQHVETVLEALNGMPKEQHGTDIMRVREWYLSGNAKHYRQTVLLSSFLNPDMNNVASTRCSSYEGCIRLVPDQPGVLVQVVPQVQQLFERFHSPCPADVSTTRFEFFKKVVWPRIKETGADGQLIFIPHYFDFVRVRNFLTAEDADFAAICEYTKPGQVTASRSRFFHRSRRIMLYTERAHFYGRHSIRGVKDVLFYALPEHAHYYSEILNLLESDGLRAAASHATTCALYCKYDLMRLERVVGGSRARKMVSAESAHFMFC